MLVKLIKNFLIDDYLNWQLLKASNFKKHKSHDEKRKSDIPKYFVKKKHVL